MSRRCWLIVLVAGTACLLGCDDYRAAEIRGDTSVTTIDTGPDDFVPLVDSTVDDGVVDLRRDTSDIASPPDAINGEVGACEEVTMESVGTFGRTTCSPSFGLGELITTEEEYTQRIVDGLGVDPVPGFDFANMWLFAVKLSTGVVLSNTMLEYCPSQERNQVTLLANKNQDEDCRIPPGWPGGSIALYSVPAGTEGGSLEVIIEDDPQFTCASGGDQDAPCSLSIYCKTGLHCVGLSTLQEGRCERPDAVHIVRNFDSTALPDADVNGVVSSNPVTGLEGTLGDVIVEVVIDHPMGSDLTVGLTLPSGREINLLGQQTCSGTQLRFRRVLEGLGRQEEPNGEWALHVADLVPENVGQLEEWSLEFYMLPTL